MVWDIRRGLLKKKTKIFQKQKQPNILIPFFTFVLLRKEKTNMAIGTGTGHANTEHKKPPSGKNFFVGIGIDAYADAHFTPLSNAKKDTERIAEIFVQKYGFEDRKDLLLFNERATGSAIIACFRGLIDLFKKEPDTHNLVVYFAGHGDFDQDSDIGFRIPSDGKYKDEKTFIEDSALLSRLRAMKAKHTLFVVDSCFSGSLVRSIESDEYIFEEQAELLTSRHIMTAGLLQTVSDGQRNDHSPFAKTLISYLETSPKTLLPFSEVALHIKRTVPRNAKGQIPYFGHLQDAGDQGGEFVLRPKEVINPEVADWETALETNTLEGFRRFRNKYPLSKNANIAEKRIETFKKEEIKRQIHAAWQATQQKNTSRAYFDFAERYFESVYFSEAMQLGNKRKDDVAWQKALDTNPPLGFLNYIHQAQSEHIDGHYLLEARARLKAYQDAKITAEKAEQEHLKKEREAEDETERLAEQKREAEAQAEQVRLTKLKEDADKKAAEERLKKEREAKAETEPFTITKTRIKNAKMPPPIYQFRLDSGISSV